MKFPKYGCAGAIFISLISSDEGRRRKRTNLEELWRALEEAALSPLIKVTARMQNSSLPDTVSRPNAYFTSKHMHSPAANQFFIFITKSEVVNLSDRLR